MDRFAKIFMTPPVWVMPRIFARIGNSFVAGEENFMEPDFQNQGPFVAPIPHGD
jgi:hypothetical protein